MRKFYILLFLILLLTFTSTVYCDDREDYLRGGDYGMGAGGSGGYGKEYEVTVTDGNGNESNIKVRDQYSAYVVSEIVGDDFKACNMKPRSGTGCPGTGSTNPHVYLDKMSGKCGCPSKPVYKIDGCNVTVSCDLEDDASTIVKINIPCPTVAGTDPKYPLVKMLSGTLVEWRVNGEYVESPHVLKYTNDSVKEGYGTEIFSGFNLNIVVSTVDTGARWDAKKAEAIVKSKDRHSRSNVEFQIVGGDPNVKVMTVKDIYEAYQRRGPEVQAYLALANKGYGERPWTTFDKFVKAMCKMSKNPYRCERSILGIDFERWNGNYWLGNGNPTILGVYSEISSHGCHGATVLDEKGQPAFGFTFKSTFCIYIHSQWDAYFNYGNTTAVHLGECCVAPVKEIVDKGRKCNYWRDDNNKLKEDCWNEVKIYWRCEQWQDLWACDDGYNYEGPGASSEDCKECIDIEGWVDAKGGFHTDPFPVSFYQSQPLLIR